MEENQVKNKGMEETAYRLSEEEQKREEVLRGILKIINLANTIMQEPFFRILSIKAQKSNGGNLEMSVHVYNKKAYEQLFDSWDEEKAGNMTMRTARWCDIDFIMFDYDGKE